MQSLYTENRYEAMRREPVLLTNLVAAVLGVTTAVVAIHLVQAAVARSRVHSSATVSRFLKEVGGRRDGGGREV